MVKYSSKEFSYDVERQSPPQTENTEIHDLQEEQVTLKGLFFASAVFYWTGIET